MIREMGTSRLQKKMTNLHAEERMLVENFNNLLKEYIKFDTMIEFNFRRCRAARANEEAYSLQSTCNSRKLQSLKDAMHDQFHEESRINNMVSLVWHFFLGSYLRNATEVCSYATNI